MAFSEDQLLDLKAQLEETIELIDNCLGYIEEERNCYAGICRCDLKDFDNDDTLQYFMDRRMSFSSLIRIESWGIKRYLQIINEGIEE